MKLFFVAVFFVAVYLIISSAQAFKISSEAGDTVEIKTKISGTDYSQGPLTAKVPEGETIEITAEFTVLSSNGFDAKLMESSSGSLKVLEGKEFGSLQSFSGVTSVDKKALKWVLQPTGSLPTTSIDIYYNYHGENRIPVTVNLANLTITTLQPQKITLVAPAKLPKGFNGEVAVEGEFFPKDMKMRALYGESEDKSINATLQKYESKTKLVFSVNVSKDAAAGPRGISLDKPSGTSYTFDNVFEIIEEGGDYSGEIKIDHEYISEKNLIYFFAYAPGYKGKPVLLINNDPAKTKYAMEPDQNKTGLFVFSTGLEKAGTKKGDLVVYTVTAGPSVKAGSGIIKAEKMAAVSPERPELKVHKSGAGGGTESLKIGEDAKFIFMSLLAGLKSIGIGIESGKEEYSIEVKIPDNPEYHGKANDFHLVFGGKIADCKTLLPEWVCKILEDGSVGLSGKDPLPAGKPVNISVVSGENITITNFWATANGTKIGAEENKPFQPEFDDCTDFYCPGLTAQQLKDKVNAQVKSACERIKNILDCLKSGKINSVMDKVSKNYQPALRNQANIQRMTKILEAALKKCEEGITIECDSKWNLGCWDEDVNAYVHVYHNIGDNLHLCPGFCTSNDQEGTIFHELTHFGDSTDDIYDDVNAHSLELNSHSIERACV